MGELCKRPWWHKSQKEHPKGPMGHARRKLPGESWRDGPAQDPVGSSWSRKSWGRGGVKTSPFPKGHQYGRVEPGGKEMQLCRGWWGNWKKQKYNPRTKKRTYELSTRRWKSQREAGLHPVRPPKENPITAWGNSRGKIDSQPLTFVHREKRKA